VETRVTRDRCYDFLNILSEKFGEKIGVFNTNQSKLFKEFDHNIGFGEKRHFFAENWQKSQKIVIITSTPGWANFRPWGDCLLWAVL
jgi:hypothetical protein